MKIIETIIGKVVVRTIMFLGTVTLTQMILDKFYKK